MRKKIQIWLALCLIISLAPVYTAAAPRESFTKAVLANGLTVLYRVMEDQPMVSMYAVIPVGSNQEKAKGLAHLLEHLVFRGGNGLTFDDIAEATSRQGGFFNGFTTFYATTFNYVVPKENFTNAFKVFNSCIWSPALLPEVIEQEKRIIVHELDLDYAERYRYYPVVRYFYPELYHSKETLAEISRQDLVDFHRNFYQPQNATYIIAGEFDPKTVLAELERIGNEFGSCQPPKVGIKGLDFPSGEISESRNLYPFQYQILMGYQFEGLSEKERMVLKLLSYIYGVDYQIDYSRNNYRVYNAIARSVGGKDYFGLFYLERSNPFSREAYQNDRAGMLNYLRRFQKVDYKNELKNFIRLVETEIIQSGETAEDAVEYEAQRLTDPDAITVDSLKLLKSISAKDCLEVVAKLFSNPPSTWILVKSTKAGVN